MTRARLLAICLVALGMAAVKDLTVQENAIVIAWLRCTDCTTELDSVRVLARLKPDDTVDTLTHALFVGPPRDVILEARMLMALTYVRDSTYRARHGQPFNGIVRDSFITVRENGMAQRYRARAAIALGWIDTPRANHALDSAVVTPLPSFVLRAVVFARDSLP